MYNECVNKRSRIVEWPEIKNNNRLWVLWHDRKTWKRAEAMVHFTYNFCKKLPAEGMWVGRSFKEPNKVGRTHQQEHGTGQSL